MTANLKLAFQVILIFTCLLKAQSVEPFWEDEKTRQIRFEILQLSEKLFKTCLEEEGTFRIEVDVTFCTKKLKFNCKKKRTFYRAAQSQKIAGIFTIREDLLGDKQQPLFFQFSDISTTYQEFSKPFFLRVTPESASTLFLAWRFLCESSPRLLLEKYLPFLNLKRTFLRQSKKTRYDFILD